MDVVDMEDGTWEWQCPCGAFMRGSDQGTIEYLAGQHTLSHTQEWAPSASEPESIEEPSQGGIEAPPAEEVPDDMPE